jgi:hypothetical protein
MDEKEKTVLELNHLRDALNQYYKNNLYNTDPEKNLTHKILFEAIQKIES